MRKHVFSAIFQFISVLFLTIGMTLGWAGYVYDGLPLISAVCFTILDILLLLFHATEYIIATAYYMEKHDKEKENDD